MDNEREQLNDLLKRFRDALNRVLAVGGDPGARFPASGEWGTGSDPGQLEKLLKELTARIEQLLRERVRSKIFLKKNF